MDTDNVDELVYRTSEQSALLHLLHLLGGRGERGEGARPNIETGGMLHAVKDIARNCPRPDMKNLRTFQSSHAYSWMQGNGTGDPTALERT